MQDAPLTSEQQLPTLTPETELALAQAEANVPTTAVPTVPPKLTDKQMRAMRRQYITINHGRVRACGHKINLSKQPNNNCDSCWKAYFKTVDNLLVTLHEYLVTQGLPALKARYGDKLVKKFARFLDNELNQERNDAVCAQEGEGSKAENGGGSTGVGSGEIQGIIQPVGDSGQEARDNQQPDATREAPEPTDQDYLHAITEPGP